MKRDARFDGLKFVLIFLVILGHMSFNSFGLPIHQAIYSFHMPLFVCISGYFSKHSPKFSIGRWVSNILGIYLIFETLHLLLNILYLNKPFSIYNYIHPDLGLWYLLSLILWRVIAYAFHKLGIKPTWKMFGISLILAIAIGFVPIGHTLSFQRTFAFYPFFILGQLVRKNEKIITLHTNYFFELLFCATAIFVSCLLPRYMPREPYILPSDALLRIEQTIDALILCICLLRLSRIHWLIHLSRLGQHTLYFYLYHTLFIRIQENILTHFHININIFHAFFLSTLYIVIILCMMQIKPFKWLLLRT